MTSNFDRRVFLKGIIQAALAAGASFSGWRTTALAISNGTEHEHHGMFVRKTLNLLGAYHQGATSNDAFYVTNSMPTIPEINTAGFALRIEGLVDRPYSITLAELEAMADKSDYVALECIANPIGGELVGTALWEGVPLWRLLQKAQPRRAIIKTVFDGSDGYRDSISYPLSLSDDVFVALRMNGESLSKEHGYPLRVIVPGAYGMKHVKWLCRVELVDYNFKGHWQKRGWSDDAVIPLKSQILTPLEGTRLGAGSCFISGIAWGGRRGIGKVQLSFNGNRKWIGTTLEKPLSRWSWTVWRYEWSVRGKGDQSIQVRAVDNTGMIQESPLLKEAKPLTVYPNGAHGFHVVHVEGQVPL